MNIKYLAAGTVAAALVAISSAAQAQPQSAVTARTTNLRAGPATDYPVVAVVPGGISLAVQGCLPEYTWCDVIAGPNRGWMAAGNINYYYQNSYVPLNNYGAAIGIGLLGFALGDYWGNNYRDRPFYRDRGRWEGRHFAEPRYVAPQRPGFVERRGDRHFDVPSNRRRDYVTRPGEVRPRVETPPPAAAPSRRQAEETQRELNQGGSNSVDPRLRPNY